MSLKCVLRALISGMEVYKMTKNIDIKGLIIKEIMIPNKKSMEGSIILNNMTDKTKAKYPLDHTCFSHALQLYSYGGNIIVTYNPDRRVIVAIRPDKTL